MQIVESELEDGTPIVLVYSAYITSEEDIKSFASEVSRELASQKRKLVLLECWQYKLKVKDLKTPYQKKDYQRGVAVP